MVGFLEIAGCGIEDWGSGIEDRALFQKNIQILTKWSAPEDRSFLNESSFPFSWNCILFVSYWICFLTNTWGLEPKCVMYRNVEIWSCPNLSRPVQAYPRPVLEDKSLLSRLFFPFLLQNSCLLFFFGEQIYVFLMNLNFSTKRRHITTKPMDLWFLSKINASPFLKPMMSSFT